MAGRFREKLKAYYPPGYDSGREWSWLGCLGGTGLGLSMGYLIRLNRSRESLYYYMGEERLLREGAAAESFGQLTGNIWAVFLPLLAVTAAMMLYHYSYYFSGSRSIYLMRRLPRRKQILKSCVQAPLACLSAEIVGIGLLYLLYYGLYLLAIPSQCRPGVI